MLDQVFIVINGVEYGGWKSIDISRNLDQAAGNFKLSVSERYPERDQPIGIRPGDQCQILINKDVVITGYVDSLNVSYDSGAHTVSVAGRSKTQDLIDCAALPPWSPIVQKTVVQVANILAEPYGVDIVDAVGQTVDPIQKVKINPSETVFQVLTKLANQSGVLLTDDVKGRLLITRAGVDRASTRLELGMNILSGSGDFQHQNRFQEYRVIGQGSMPDENTIAAEVRDEGVRRTRVHIVRGEGDLDAKKAEDRARWEAATRSGQSSQLTYTVQGWRQENGALWAVNQLIAVKDKYLTVNGLFLISGVAFSLSDRGSLTTLEVVPPSAFEIRPPTIDSATKDIGAWAELVEPGTVTP